MRNWFKIILLMMVSLCGWSKNGEFVYDENIKEIEGELKITPNDDELIFRRAYIYFSKEDYDKAITDLDRCVRLRPDEQIYYFFRAKANIKIGRIRAAMDDFNKSTQLKPEHAECYFYLGILHHQVKEHYAAERNFNKAIEICSTESRYYAARARFKKEIGRVDEAMEDYNKALELDPEFTIVLYEITWVNFELRNFDKALDYADRMMLYGGQNHIYLDTLACVSSVKDLKKAIKYESKAIELAGEDCDNYKEKLQYFKKGINYEIYKLEKEKIEEDKKIQAQLEKTRKEKIWEEIVEKNKEVNKRRK